MLQGEVIQERVERYNRWLKKLEAPLRLRLKKGSGDYVTGQVQLLGSREELLFTSVPLGARELDIFMRACVAVYQAEAKEAREGVNG